MLRLSRLDMRWPRRDTLNTTTSAWPRYTLIDLSLRLSVADCREIWREGLESMWQK
ncbi:hypothetical protein D1T48_gp17 [Thermoproteus tenax virus 1]|uniref:Uncharacterized 6.7 kDa protein n=1 Tax=Thermoproteus tenax virus 1 (strain KRA1) TaxID=10480 RepID=YORF_TTV1K|nr:hypothetical protein D1T48_gp17 [Thermoproteus tenax virus 1]P19290.1 RecName: Full=Uncharacterized 6.7 kDa protein [Thermoproteus tenax virus 1 (STRAIN KRA1)]CAA32984.1 unnamed protein product [Thermoproteus tenax virus 1]